MGVLTPGGSNTWTAVISHPETGNQHDVVDLTIPADTVLVFPGTFTGGVTDDIDWWSAATPDGQPNTVENAARNVRLNFMGKNLQLKSVAGPSETIITCDGLSDSFGLQFINGELS